MPKVSVIVPVYNVDLYLRACLGSICSQKLQDFEAARIKADKSAMIFVVETTGFVFSTAGITECLPAGILVLDKQKENTFVSWIAMILFTKKC